MSASFLKWRFFKVLNRAIEKRPYLINSLIYGGTCAAAELAVQLIEREKTTPINWTRITHFGIIGLTFNGPVGHVWYTWLDRFIPGTGILVLAKKLLLDQTICGGAYIAAFYIGMSFLEGQPDIFLECRQKFWETLRYSCCFWTCAQLVNFLVLPTQLRVVYIATVNFLWVTVLALMKRVEVRPNKQVSITSSLMEKRSQGLLQVRAESESLVPNGKPAATKPKEEVDSKHCKGSTTDS